MLDKGIARTCIKPRTSRLNGKAERSHRIDAEEFYRLLDGFSIDDAAAFNDKLREWEGHYTHHRPHRRPRRPDPPANASSRRPRPRRIH
ncbi:integrase core domain-containing protein [Streptomyces sp. NPDC048277]|uniref:integrase core domain-containing protein n=1 Tax=Streptomyces sp. NPDC048277 TaxID=3155027 RepID=UPI0033F58A4A